MIKDLWNAPVVPVIPVAVFSTTHGSTTIKTTVYHLAGDSVARDIERVQEAKMIAMHRAEQLEPPKPRPMISPDWRDDIAFYGDK